MFGLSKHTHEHRGRLIQKWTFNARSPVLSGAVAADMNGDGQKEVLFGTKDGHIFCITAGSEPLWEYKPSGMGETESLFYDREVIESVPATPVVADVNNDGAPEVLFGTERGTVQCLSAEGKLLWRHNAKDPIRGRLLVADHDNDGALEVLFGTAGGRFYILDAKGKERHVFELKDPVESEAALLNNQLIFGSESGTIRSYDALGKALWSFKAAAAVKAAPAIGHLHDGASLLVGDLDGILYCLSLEGHERWRFETRGSIYGRAAVDDINRDGRPEILFGSCDNKVYCLSEEGDRHWSYETDFWVVASPLLFDIDGDGRKEVVIGSYDHTLYVLDGEGSYTLDYMPGLSGVAHQTGGYSGVVTQEPGEQVAKKLWHFKAQGMIVGCELLDKDQVIINVKTGEIDSVQHARPQ